MKLWFSILYVLEIFDRFSPNTTALQIPHGQQDCSKLKTKRFLLLTFVLQAEEDEGDWEDEEPYGDETANDDVCEDETANADVWEDETAQE